MTERKPQSIDSEPLTTADETLRAIVTAYGLLNRVMQPFFGQHGISTSQWGVLVVLYRARQAGEHRLRMVDIGQRLLIRPPSVTGVVSRLERQGLLRRATSSNDLRTKEVCLTAAGSEIVHRIISTRHEHVRRLMSGLTEEEQKELTVLLGRFIDHMDTIVNGQNAVGGND